MSQLNDLIEEQKKDRSGRYVFPERIKPRRSVLFVPLSPRQKACLILSLFMRRRDIAEALKIVPRTVTDYIKISTRKLPPEEVRSLQAIRSAL